MRETEANNHPSSRTDCPKRRSALKLGTSALARNAVEAATVATVLLTAVGSAGLLGATAGCASGGTPGARSAGEGEAGLTEEQRGYLERYRKLVRLAEKRTKARAHREALQALARAEVLAQRIHGPSHPIFARTQRRFGKVYVAMGRHDLAAKAYEKELARLKRALRPGDNIVRARCLHRIGRSWFHAGELDKAARYLTRAVDMRRATLDKPPRRLGKHYVETSEAPRAPGLADSLHQLGLVRWKQKKHAAAAKGLREAVQIRRKHLRSGHLDLLQSLLGLAQLEEILGKQGAAEKLYLELVNRVGKRRRPVPSLLGTALRHLGDLYRRTERYPQAERYYDQARKLAREAKRFARREVYLARIDVGLAMVYAETKRADAAAKRLEEAIAVFKKNPKVNANHAVRAYVQLGKLERGRGRIEAASKAVRSGLNLASERLGPRSYAYARAQAELAELYVAKKAPEHGVKLLRRAFEITRDRYGAQHPRTQRLRKRLVALYRELGQEAKVRELSQ
jgi:tetratricopeptide (TPR) repeat protein